MKSNIILTLLYLDVAAHLYLIFSLQGRHTVIIIVRRVPLSLLSFNFNSILLNYVRAFWIALVFQVFSTDRWAMLWF